jgi:hypothetical protein
MRLLLFTLLIFIAKSGFSQGLNNSNKTDNYDINKIFELQDIHTHKFKFATTKPQQANIIIRQFINGVAADTFSLKDAYEKAGIPLQAMLPLVHAKSGFLRVYFQKIDSVMKITFDVNNNAQTITFDFNKITVFGTRTFDKIALNLNKKERIVCCYGNQNSRQEMHCSLNDSDADLAKRFDNVILVEVEPWN